MYIYIQYISTYHHTYRFSLVCFFFLLFFNMPGAMVVWISDAFSSHFLQESCDLPLCQIVELLWWLRSVLVVDTWLEHFQKSQFFVILKSCKTNKDNKKDAKKQHQHPNHSPFVWWGIFWNLFFNQTRYWFITISRRERNFSGKNLPEKSPRRQRRQRSARTFETSAWRPSCWSITSGALDRWYVVLSKYRQWGRIFGDCKKVGGRIDDWWIFVGNFFQNFECGTKFLEVVCCFCCFFWVCTPSVSDSSEANKCLQNKKHMCFGLCSTLRCTMCFPQLVEFQHQFNLSYMSLRFYKRTRWVAWHLCVFP